jgi:phosphatidylglycerophosphate synthase
MKYIVNAITLSRMLLSVLLLCFLNNRPVFFIVFMLCGISDIIDGILARKTGTKSTFGARLDSFADLLLFGMITVCVIIWAGGSLKSLLPYLGAVISIRFANIAIAAFKYHSFAIIHTWGSKITGILVFVSYAIFIVLDNVNLFIPVCIIAVLSALEETILHVTSDKLDLDRPSIFKKGGFGRP